MELEKLLQYYKGCAQAKALAQLLTKDDKLIFLEGLQASAAPLLFSALRSSSRRTFVFILQDADEAGYFYHDLTQLMGEDGALFFPSSYRRAIKYAQKDPASEILRTEVLTRLSHPEALCPYIVSYPEAIAEKVAAKTGVNQKRISLTAGQTIEVDALAERLEELGFQETDYVYEPGQFARRGSLIDIYSFSHELPFRVDFFGDEIESMRTFTVEDQLSKERVERVDVMPSLSETEEKTGFLSFLPADALLVMRSYGFICDQMARIYEDGFAPQALQERMEGATEVERATTMRELHRDSMIVSGTQFAADATPFTRIELRTRPAREQSVEKSTTLRFNISAQPLFHKNFELLVRTLEDYRLKGFSTFVMADSPKQIARLQQIVAQPEFGGSGAELFTPVGHTLHEGFVDNNLRACFFTDHQIFDRFHKYNLKSDKARSGKMALTLKELQMFEVGDYIVHLDHGIGRFGGLVRMPLADGGHQEMIKITYQRGDCIYVSIHSLYKVSKYKSQEGGTPPRLSTLGTGQWERLKERTKTHIKDIARDLIKLYATRRHQRGFAFSHDSYMQHELEASFLYEDTPDQLRATSDVKADMEKAQPMDRLLCGDVGFGKTEVAVRAAFKAACDGKQVAVLVPTTVLAYQHYHTFAGRLKDMPVRVDYLTRARTAKQTTALLKDLADGRIDILIGTHKLIGKSVKFHDLGLLIIDEEQKFGVSTKEKLRQMKTNVDTLTMSATPIPRTLQFSLVGARDLSIIQTPPPNRYPIQTEIHLFSPEIIADAINFELSRNGQVYFVNNRINDLTRLAEIIHKYVPDARVAIGHGQMKPEELEKIVLDFSNHDSDVLLSTTIVENGIDIPNANTIIINGAHNFGLSDLHQMRGRVGRGNRKAFCYLLAPPLSALPADSRKRLEALENFSDLGSGINIAMQDLDLRGAGNLLGAEQSGFITDLGYETYQKILNEAMTELKNEMPAEEQVAQVKEDSGEYVADCTLESDLEMYFPDSYVPSDSERMLLYRQLMATRNDNELKAFEQKLIDRFGRLPWQARELLNVVPLRLMGKQLGCEKILLKQGQMFLCFVTNALSPFYQSKAFDSALSFAANNVRRCALREQNAKRSMVVKEVSTVEEAVKTLRKIIS